MLSWRRTRSRGSDALKCRFGIWDRVPRSASILVVLGVSAREPLHAASPTVFATSEVRESPAAAWLQSFSSSTIANEILLAALAILIVGMLWQRSRRRRAERAVLEREATLHASYDRIRRLTGGLIDAQESTRAAVARDLHDDVCQELVAIALGVNNLKSSYQMPEPMFQEALRRLHRRTLTTVDGVRRLSHDLHPATLRLLGLPAALRAHCVEVEQRYDVQVNLNVGTNVGTILPDLSLCLFRIAQEALRNGAVHGEARHMDVALLRVADEIELTISDDGCGFDADAVRRDGGGIGLVSMEERIRLSGGRFEVLSRPGIGTSIRVGVRAQPARVVDQPVLVRRAGGAR
jgi:signal transduction histidine kinase